MVKAVFYDNDYRRMETTPTEPGKAVIIPPGAMFVCLWNGEVPEDVFSRKGNPAKTGNGH